jgi:pyruvate/2-oxoglutarate dehydrogenase complex dihydrolipoamide acyltransferase (E2) component
MANPEPGGGGSSARRDRRFEDLRARSTTRSTPIRHRPFTAVINPPEAAILAVGTTSSEPVVEDGQLATRQRMKLTLSIDHRALDGATGAQFLADLKATLEEPLRILA